MQTRIAAAVGAAALVFMGLTGCSVSVGGKSISQSELENKTAEALQPKFNDKITAKCKGSLKAKTGETQQCAITADGKWQLVTVTATNDEGKFNANAVPGVVPQPDWAK